MAKEAYKDSKDQWRISIDPYRGKETLMVYQRHNGQEETLYSGQFTLIAAEHFADEAHITLLREEVEELRDALTDLLEKTK